MNRLQNLDLLRLLAALMVLMFHYTFRGYEADRINPFAYPELAWLTRYGGSGVSLFFMISGFVIAASAEGRSAAAFALARVARLYPAFVFCMTLTAIIIFSSAVHHAGLPVSFRQWAANLVIFAPFLKQPYMDGVYWSIVIEIIFYGWVFLFILLGWFHKYQLYILSVWLCISAALHFLGVPDLLLKLFAAEYAGHFTLGILSYRFYKNQKSVMSQDIYLGICALIIAIFNSIKISVDTINFAQYFIVAFLVLASLFILNVAVYTRPLLNAQLSLLLGGLTYPLYLLHQNIGYVLFKNFYNKIDRWFALGVVTTLSLLLSLFVYKSVEPYGRRIILDYGENILKRLGITV